MNVFCRHTDTCQKRCANCDVVEKIAAQRLGVPRRRIVSSSYGKGTGFGYDRESPNGLMVTVVESAVSVRRRQA